MAESNVVVSAATIAKIGKRSPERQKFLADLLCGAIEHGGYGFTRAIEYEWSDDEPGATYAVVANRYGDDPKGTRHTVTLDTMAKGLGIIRRAFLATCEVYSESTHMHNADTWECLGFGGDERTQLLLADRTNGDDGDYDVVGALAVLECAIYGVVVYG